MAAPAITPIEDAIVAAIKAALPAVRAVRPYAGEITPETLRALADWPHVLVTHNGVAGVADHGRRRIEASRWLVIVGDRHRTDLALARRGSATNPGTYALLRGVQTALEGRALLSDLLPGVRLGEDTLVNESGLSIYACHYEVGVPYLI